MLLLHSCPRQRHTTDTTFPLQRMIRAEKPPRWMLKSSDFHIVSNPVVINVHRAGEREARPPQRAVPPPISLPPLQHRPLRAFFLLSETEAPFFPACHVPVQLQLLSPSAGQLEGEIPAFCRNPDQPSLLLGAGPKPTLAAAGAGQMLSRCATHKDAQQDQIPWEIPPAGKREGLVSPAVRREAAGCIIMPYN